MRLDEWLRKTETKPSAFARRIGVPSSTLLRMLREKRSGTHDTMVRIIVGTGGEVLPNDFFDIPALLGPVNETEAA